MKPRGLPLFPTQGRPKAYRAARPPRPLEYQLHKAVADHLRAFADPAWRWSHFPSGEHRTFRTGAKLRRMGLQKGWPDFVLVAPSGLMHGLELKLEGETMTEEQETFAQ